MAWNALNQEHLATVLNAAPVAMIVSNPLGQIVFANRQASSVFGFSSSELENMTVSDLIPERIHTGHDLRIKQFFADPTPRVMGIGREVIGVNRNGREVPLEIGLTPFQSSQGPLAIAAIVDITERRRRETDSTLAQLVQRSMLPTAAPRVVGLDISAFSEPADAAGGDFYDYIPLDDDRLAVIIGDASGHGFAAALVTVAARSYLRAFSSVERDVSQILVQVNSLLLKDGLDGRFVTLFYAVLDSRRRTIRFAGAGHTAYVFSAEGMLKQLLPSTGPPLGWFPEANYPCDNIAIAPGDLLLMLTDGIEESMDPTGEPFGRQRLVEFIRTHGAKSAAEITRGLHEVVHKFHGVGGQHDDATVITAIFLDK